MRTQLRRMGNSSGVIIPRPIMAQLGMEPGAELDLRLEDGRIVLTPAPPVRAGWAEAAKAIAEAGDDALVWDEFGNAEDAELTW
ncbi:AbrB/MazE/SpoVT family DNA-binding domain-containing protein [Roseicella aquatilis]|uniref:AbrB/MazE/SpoVT family DNA-binding domain-containing protein n=1 Tax=Roseicella aquatilis TaxID=2527868 RepID=A0A4R4DBG6_9PROT|nr:AbrB/MazE/SpoVT family DNA-binding domain-containing protein [Roseicella aquatilis]TCZ57827.1 AbrB/MazE/SpoVT family DNA-binding domain-containing protein [Roseicella aquatilis]